MADGGSARDTLIESLKTILKARLRAIYRFGSDLARGKGVGRDRLLVLVESVDRGLLDEVSEAVWDAQKEGVHVRIDSADNLIRGADAFPAFALELRNHRELISGDDVLRDLDVNRAHLRLHVEHGLRSMHRDLIKLYLERGSRSDEVAELRRNLRKLVFLLEGALMAAGRPIPEPHSLGSVLKACCIQLLEDADRGPWQKIEHFATNDVPLRGESGRELYAALLDALGQIIPVVDRM